jgi:hypothetical protein
MWLYLNTVVNVFSFFFFFFSKFLSSSSSSSAIPRVSVKGSLRRHSKDSNPLFKVSVVLPSVVDDVDKVRSEDERHPLSFDAQLALEVAQEMAEINMEQLKHEQHQIKPQ